MGIRFVRPILVLASLLSLAPSAKATEATFFNLNFGYPSVTVEIDPRNKPSLGSSMVVGADMWRTLGDLPLGFGLSTVVYLGGAFGSLPVMQTGFPLLYFPWSRPISNYSVADDVVVQSSSWSPYLKLTPGFEFMNFRNDSLGAKYGSSSIYFTESVGVFFPSSSNSHWLTEISYTSTLNATDATTSPIAVSGFLIMAGYSFRFQ